MRTVFLFPRAERQETAWRLDELAISRQLPGQRTEWVLENLAWIRLDDRDGQFFDCPASFDASELLFYVVDMPVTLSSRRGLA